MFDRILLFVQTVLTLLISWPGLTVAALVAGALWVASLHTIDDEPTPPTTPGATFGPWADHHPNCQCNVCR